MLEKLSRIRVQILLVLVELAAGKQSNKMVKTGFENPDFSLWINSAAGPAQRRGALRVRALRGAPVRHRGAPPLFWHFGPFS